MSIVVLFTLGLFFTGAFIVALGLGNLFSKVGVVARPFCAPIMGMAQVFIGLGICWGVTELGAFLIHHLK